MNELAYLRQLGRAEQSGLSLPGKLSLTGLPTLPQTRYERLLFRAEITLSPFTYIAMSLGVGLLTVITFTHIGPHLRFCAGVLVFTEFAFTLPRELATRRALTLLRGLPQFVEIVRQKILSGMQMEVALAQSPNLVVDAVVRNEITDVVRRIQRGSSAMEALAIFAHRQPLPEVRFLVAALHMFKDARTAACAPLAQVRDQLAVSSSRIDRQVKKLFLWRCVFFIIAVPLLIVGMSFHGYLIPHGVLQELPESTLLTEVGAVAILAAAVVWIRATSLFSAGELYGE